MVNRYRVDHGAIHRDWPPGHMDMVTAADYDELQAKLDKALLGQIKITGIRVSSEAAVVPPIFVQYEEF